MFQRQYSWTLNASDALPRTIPSWLRRYIWMHSSVLTGWLGLCIAIAGVSFQLVMGYLPGDWLLILDKEQATGTITEVRETTTRRTKSRPPQRVVHRHYTFTLPDGRVMQGVSSSLGGPVGMPRRFREPPNARVQIEYVPSFPEKNRIKGGKIGDSGLYFLFGIVLPTISLVMGTRGSMSASRLLRMLKCGEIRQASVTHCISHNRIRFIAELQSGDWRLKGELPARFGSELRLPLAEFHQHSVTQHRQQFDDRGRYIGSPALRSNLVVVGAFMGAMVGAFVGFISSLLIFDQPEGKWIVGTAVISSLLAALIERRWRVLIRSSQQPMSIDAPPKTLSDVSCVLQIQDDQRPGLEFHARLSLAGDSTDSELRPVLVDLGSKAMPQLLSHLEVPATLVGEDCVQIVVNDYRVRRFSVLAGVCIVVISLITAVCVR